MGQPMGGEFSARAARTDAGALRDIPVDQGVGAVATVYEGAVWRIRSQQVRFGDGTTSTREWLEHPGAVAVLAVRDGDDGLEIAVVQQYRHPVRRLEWEVVAGMLDVAGEEPHLAAARELAEEADLRARTWHVLADYCCSPGSMSEAIRIYVARDLEDVPQAERHAREHEEHDMARAWVRLDEAVAAVIGGRWHNPSTVIGVLALERAVRHDWAGLRPVDAPWEGHPGLRRR